MCLCCCCISFLKGPYTLFLLYISLWLNFSWKAGKSQSASQKKSWVRNCYFDDGFIRVSFWLDVSSKLIRWNAWDQFQTVKFKSVGSRPVTYYYGHLLSHYYYSWYRTMDFDFETKCLFGMYQVHQGHLLWLEVTYCLP